MTVVSLNCPALHGKFTAVHVTAVCQAQKAFFNYSSLKYNSMFSGSIRLVCLVGLLCIKYTAVKVSLNVKYCPNKM